MNNDVTSKCEAMNGENESVHGDIHSRRMEMFSRLALDLSGNEASPLSSPTLSPVFLSPGSNTNKLIAAGKIKDCFILLQKTEVEESCLETLVEAKERFSRSTRESTPTSVLSVEDEELEKSRDAYDHSHECDETDTRPEFDSNRLKANRNLFTSFLRDYPKANTNSSVDVEGSQAASHLKEETVFECDEVSESFSTTKTGVHAVDASKFHRERRLSDDLMSISSTGSSETIVYPIDSKEDTEESSDWSSDKHSFEHEQSLEFQDEPPRLERLESLPESSSCLDNPPVLSPLVMASTNNVQFFAASSSSENIETYKPSIESMTNKIDEQKLRDSSETVGPSGPTRRKPSNNKNTKAFSSIPPVNNIQTESHCLIPHYLLNSVNTDQTGQRHQNTRDEWRLSSLTTDTACESADTTIDSACSPQMENRPYVEAESWVYTKCNRRLPNENKKLVTPTKALPRASAPDPQIVAVMSLRETHSTLGQEPSENRKELFFLQSVAKATSLASNKLDTTAPSVEQTSTDTSFGHNPTNGENEVSALTHSPHSALCDINSDLEMERAVASISEIQQQANGETDENPKYVFESNIELTEVVIDPGADGSNSPACTIGAMYSMDEVAPKSQVAEESQSHCESTQESEPLSNQVEADEARCSGQVRDIQSKPTDHRGSNVKPTAHNDLEESMRQSLVGLDSRRTVKENGKCTEVSKAPVNQTASLESDKRIQRETDRTRDKANDIPVPNSVPNEPRSPEFPKQIELVASSIALLHHNTTNANSSSTIDDRLQTKEVPSNTLEDDDSVSKSRDGVKEILDRYEASCMAQDIITGPERSTRVFDKVSNESCANTNPRTASTDGVVLPLMSKEMDTAISLANMAEMAPQNQAGNLKIKTSVQSTTRAPNLQLNSQADDVRVRHQSASGTSSAIPQDTNAELNLHRPHSSKSAPAPVSENQNGACAPGTLGQKDQTVTKSNRGRTRGRVSSGFAVVDYSNPARPSGGQFDELKWRLLTDRGIQSEPVKQVDASQQVLLQRPQQVLQQVLPILDGPTKEQNRYKPKSRRDIVSYGVGIPIECGGKRLVAYNTEILRPPMAMLVNQANGQIDIRNSSSKFPTRDNNSAISSAPPSTPFHLPQNNANNLQHYQTNPHANNQQIPQSRGGVTSTSASKIYQQHPQVITDQRNAIFLGKQAHKSPSHLRQQEGYPTNISWTSQPSSTPCTYPGNVAVTTQTSQHYKTSNIPRREINSRFTHPNNVGTIYLNANQPVSVISGLQASSTNAIASNYPTQSYQAQQQMFVLSQNSATTPDHFSPNKGRTLAHATRVGEYQHTGTSRTTNVRNMTPAVSVAAIHNRHANATTNNNILESAIISGTEQITKQPAVPLNWHEESLRPTNIASSYITNLAQRERAAESGLYQNRDSSYLSRQKQETAGRRQSVTNQTIQRVNERGYRGLDTSLHEDRQQVFQVPTTTTSHSSARYQTKEKSPLPTVQDPNSLTNNLALQRFSEGERALLNSLPMQLAKYLIDLNNRGLSISEGMHTISEVLFDEKDGAQGRGQEPEKQVLDKWDKQRREWHSTIHYRSADAPQPRNQQSGVSSQVAGHLNPAQHSGQPNVAVTNNIDLVHPHHTSITLTRPEAASTENTHLSGPQDTPVCNTDEDRQNQEAEQYQARDLVNKFRSFHNPPPHVRPLLEADDVRLSTEGQAITSEGEERVVKSPQHTKSTTAIDLSTHTMKGRSKNTHENAMFVDGYPYCSDNNSYHRAYSAGGYGPIRVSSLGNLSSQALSPTTDEFTSPELSSPQLLIRERLLERRLRIKSRSISTPDILHGYDYPKKRRKVFPEPFPEDKRRPMVGTEPQMPEIVGRFRESDQETLPVVSTHLTVWDSGRDSSPVQGFRDIGHPVIDLTGGDNKKTAIESNMAAQYPKIKSSLQSRWVNQSVQTSRILTPDLGDINSTESILSSSDLVVTDKNVTPQAIQQQMCVPTTTSSASVLPDDQQQLPTVGNTQDSSAMKTPTVHTETGSVRQTVRKRSENHRQPKVSNPYNKRKAEETPGILFTSCKFCSFEGRLSEVRVHTNVTHFAKHCKKDSAPKPAVNTVGTAPPKPITRDMVVNMPDQTITVPVTVNSTNTCTPNNNLVKGLVDSNVNVDVGGRSLSTPTAVFHQMSGAIPPSVSSRGVLTVASSPQPFQLEITRAVAPRTDRQPNETWVAEATSPPSQPAIGTGTTVAKFSPTISLQQTYELVCKRCGQSCKTVKDLEIHVKLHHTNTKGVHMCFTCGRTCKTNHGLIKHIQKRHVDRGRMVTGQLYSCVHSECGLAFPSKRELTRHLRSHFKRKYICELCDAKFDYLSELRHHQLQHTDTLSYQCKVCELKFRTAGMLYRHELHGHHSSLSKR